MKAELLKDINRRIGNLDDKDREAVMWWNHFKEFIEDFKPKSPKKKPLEERKKDFYNKLVDYASQPKYGKELTRNFYNYWTEHNEGSNTMRFEMKKNQPFNIGRRMGTFLSMQKDDGVDRAATKLKEETHLK